MSALTAPLAVLALASLAGAWLAARGRAARWSSLCAALVAAGWLAGALSTRRAWEATARRAVYVSAHALGVALDRGVELGLAAACFALAGCVLAWSDREAPPWALRAALGLSSACALGALGTILHAAGAAR